MAAIAVFLFENPVDPTILSTLGYILLYIAAALTLWSMLVYLKAAWPDLMPKDESK
jgi:CDP-diacylglycerol--glycerol-3-phosphate 3-phosphatidyltransferase